MSKTPEALRLQHDKIEQLREQNTALDAACAKLEKERDELIAALKWISKRCPAHMEDSLLNPIHQEMAHDAGACARAAIARMPRSSTHRATSTPTTPAYLTRSCNA